MRKLIDVPSIVIQDRMYVFDTTPYVLEYDESITRIYVVEGTLDGFLELNPDAPLKTYNPEAILSVLPEYMEFITITADTEDNAALVSALYSAGLCASDECVTEAELRLLVNSQLGDVFKDNTDLESFDEFAYCTNITKLQDGAFSGCSNLESIIIPESVYKIGDDVFAGCESLDSLKVASNNAVYDDYGCNAIYEKESKKLIAGCNESQIYDECKVIGKGAFKGSDIEEVIIPDSVQEIQDEAFSGCAYLESVYIGSGLKNIGAEAFSYCGGLSSIEVDENNTVFNSGDDANAIIDTLSYTVVQGCVNTDLEDDAITAIGDYAFKGQDAITEITIPSNITAIGDQAFHSCTSLTVVNIESATPATLGQDAFNNVGSGFKIVVPAGCGDTYKAASGWSEYASVIEEEVMPDASVSATFTVQPMRSVTYPTQLTYEGKSSNLDYMVVDDYTYVLKGHSDPSLETFNFTQTGDHTVDYIFRDETTINDYMFNDCSAMTYVNMAYAVETIGYNAFAGCSGLSEIDIPDNVTTINSYAFESCDNLTYITIGEGIETIGESAFAYTQAESITIKAETPPSMEGAFTDSNISYVYVPEGSETDYAEEIDAPNIDVEPIGPAVTCKVIGYYDGQYAAQTIFNANNIDDIISVEIDGVEQQTISSSVKLSISPKYHQIIYTLKGDEIPSGFFNGANKLSSGGGLYIDESVKVINSNITNVNVNIIIDFTTPPTINSTPFGSTNYKVYVPSSAVDTYKALSNLDQSKVFALSEKPWVISLTTSTATTTIFNQYGGPKALFYKLIVDDVVQDTIPTQDYTFSSTGDHVLKLYTVDQSNNINGNMFWGCSTFTSITMPDDITLIYGEFCYNCTGITSITIPASVTTINKSAFNGCSSLASVYIMNTTPPTLSNTNAFSNNASGRKFYVPNDYVDVYKAASGWSNYASDIEAIPMPSVELELRYTPMDAGELCFLLCPNMTQQEATAQFTHMEIDGVDQQSVLMTYTFNDTNEHVVKLTLDDPTEINFSVFQETQLTYVKIPATVTTITNIGMVRGSGTSFDVDVDDDNTTFEISNYTLYDTVTNTVLYAMSGASIPSSTLHIADYAFAWTGISSASLPSSLLTIGEYAFIDNEIQSLTIPASVTAIGDHAFASDFGLYPAQVTMLGTTPPTITDDIDYAPFYVDSGFTITVPSGYANVYKAAWTCYAEYIQ